MLTSFFRRNPFFRIILKEFPKQIGKLGRATRQYLTSPINTLESTDRYEALSLSRNKSDWFSHHLQRQKNTLDISETTLIPLALLDWKDTENGTAPKQFQNAFEHRLAVISLNKDVLLQQVQQYTASAPYIDFWIIVAVAKKDFRRSVTHCDFVIWVRNGSVLFHEKTG